MAGVSIADTIIVRTIEKGTKVIREPAKKLIFAGAEYKEYQKQRQKLAGDLGLASSKGTNLIHLGNMLETEVPSISGHYLSTSRGTSTRMG
ncbi:MAG: hypothetical protein ACREAX_01845 [Candidatus Nitrosotenuis sp.]